MKYYLTSLCLIIVASLEFVSCNSYNYVPQHYNNRVSDDTSTDVDLRNTSFNSFDLKLLGDPVEYEINIASDEGAQLLKGQTLREAKERAVWKACQKYHCAVIFSPHFDYLMQDGRILRVTMRGTPANYKNQTRDNNSNNRNINININGQ